MTAQYQIITGDNRSTLKTIADNTIDAIVTDPPYGIDFLGKAWDANTGALETYQECLRVLKPGGHILAFSAARTYHHLAVTLEQSGFEIRDQIMWIYSSGFPKSQDVGRTIQRSLGVKEYEKMVDTTKNAGFGQTDHARVRAGVEWSTPARQVGQVKVTDPAALPWAGWGTALKPAHEPICLARKPMKLSIARNCQEWGVGALNIDATRIASTDLKPGTMGKAPPNLNAIGSKSTIETSDEPWIPNDAGRFPSNVIGEIPLYQKYFYSPKVSRRERHVGFDDLPKRLCGPGGDDFVQAQDHQRSNKNVGNNHPTVKPIELMKYLIRLITPPGGTVLDPFTGSGSTGCAAVELGHDFIGCELDPHYVAIANRRIQAWLDETLAPQFRALFDVE